MLEATSKNKRIAKNTLFLYFRMFIIMAVSLFTSRILLQKLGVEDFGIYNIVGGIIVVFSFMQAPISSATQRFINYALGENDLGKVQKVFSVSMFLYMIFCALAIILGETLGLWFFNTQMNIPEVRLFAANVIYQFTILTFCLNLIRTPYYASVIAYERRDFFAYWSVIMAVLKLVIVYIIVICSYDRLITYAFLYAVITFLELITMIFFCKIKFTTTHFSLVRDPVLTKEITSFSGWSLLGGVANTASQYGLNVLINIFFGVTINAAIGIANQVSSALYQLISNFQIAFNPQMVALYAQGKKEQFLMLIERASKFSYYLFLVVSVPFIIFIEPILSYWLGFVPLYCANFCRLILVFNLLMAASNPLWMSVQATGNIKKYQIIMSSLLILNFPISYLCLKLGTSAYSIWIVRVLVEVVVYIVRLYYLKGAIGINANRYIFITSARMGALFLLNILISYGLYNYYNETFMSLLLLMFFSAIITGGTSFIFGFSGSEKKNILQFIFKRK